jgi:FMN phosphatase YigB (HAD superfamily)
VAYPTAKYIERDDSLVRTLQQLRRAGKKTFLLTNSFWPYVDVVMKHLVQSET